MKIELINTGKRYNREWIFRECNYTFLQGKAYAITGSNGTGKSTLLQTIAGAVTPSEGSLEYTPIPNKGIYEHLALAAPYLELIEEMTSAEMLQFHTSFKPFIAGIGIKEILELVGLGMAAKKQIRFYSSGMKQRLKLAQAIFSDVPILLLDEPCTNLDDNGIQLYKSLVKQYGDNKLIIVCSNDKQEYDFCTETINIHDYKPSMLKISQKQ